MAKDIEEFLRRAAERRKKQQQQQAQRRPAQPAPRPTQKPARKQPSQRQKRPMVSPGEIEFVTPAKRQHDFRNETIQEHVSHYLNTSDIAEHAENLGEKLQLVDERVEQRLQQKFDHDVGKLESKPSVTDEITESTGDAISPIAKDLLELLSQPKTIRQAILVSEILSRPKFDEE